MAALQLQALERDFLLIDSNFRDFCASHGIFSVEDFLVHDLDKLSNSAEQYYTRGRLKQGISQVLSIIDNHHPCIINGMELLEDAEKDKCVISTGCEWIDVLLEGGLHEGQVTELVGPSSSGKTQICLLAAAHVARTYSGKVLYFDSGNSFSAKRIARFIIQSSDCFMFEVNKDVEQVMRSIVCHSVFDISTLLDMLRQLIHDLKHQMGHRIRFLIIDSLSSLIAPVLKGGDCHGHGLMVTAGFLLKELAQQHNLSVVVTNHMVSGECGTIKPALGESWKNIPHVRLLLSRPDADNGGSISIIKHPYLATGKNLTFKIT